MAPLIIQDHSFLDLLQTNQGGRRLTSQQVLATHSPELHITPSTAAGKSGT